MHQQYLYRQKLSYAHERLYKNYKGIRKSATGVIVALAVIWGGGTWYTGTQIQPGVEKFIKDFNDAKKKEMCIRDRS